MWLRLFSQNNAFILFCIQTIHQDFFIFRRRFSNPLLQRLLLWCLHIMVLLNLRVRFSTRKPTADVYAHILSSSFNVSSTISFWGSLWGRALHCVLLVFFALKFEVSNLKRLSFHIQFKCSSENCSFVICRRSWNGFLYFSS